MCDLKNKAMEKMLVELNEYRNKIYNKNPKEIYQESCNIIFAEGIVYHLKQLIEDSLLAKLISEEEKTITGAVIYITGEVRKKYGNSGDLSTDEFQSLIWEYYTLNPEKAKEVLKKSIPERNRLQKKHEQKSLFSKSKDATVDKKGDQIIKIYNSDPHGDKQQLSLL